MLTEILHFAYRRHTPLLQLGGYMHPEPPLSKILLYSLVGAVVYYCTVRKKFNCQKCYSLTVAHQQQPAPVYEDVVGQSQNIELKENVTYGPVQQ